MAIIYSYPEAQSLTGNDLLTISLESQAYCTKSVSLSKLVEFINGQPSGGVGTTNSIVKFTDGPGGLIGDSIMNEDIDKINLNGILSIAESNNQKLEIKFGTDSSLTHDNTPGANDNLIIGRAGDLIIRNRARTRDVVFQADDGQFDGNVTTYFRLDGSMADLGNPDLYTRWGDNSRIVLGDSANTNSLDFEMYYDGSDTYLINGESFLNVESKGGIFIENKTSSGIDIINSAVGGDISIQATDDIKFTGGTGEFFRIDTGIDANKTFKDIIFPDNVKATFGNGSKFSIYTDATDSYIENNDLFAGDLYIRNNSNDKDIIFQTDDGLGGVITYFSCDGSEAGSGFTQTIWPDNNQIVAGTNKDIAIFRDSLTTRSVIQNINDDLEIINNANDQAVRLKCDNGSGGTTDYIVLDGNDVSTNIETIKVLIPNLPVADPANAGQLWNDGGTLKVSAG
tara:strand:+ start:412 stop:1773 length:1362 start_codon:yes stop_codon:yes gene_type:complete